MAAGAAAMFVVVGGSAAGVATIFAPAPDDVTAAAAEPDLGAPYLEESPEVVSRAAAAAQPLPQRQGDAPQLNPNAPQLKPKVPPKPPAMVEPPTMVKPPVKQVDRLSRERVADDKADRTGPRPARPAAKQAPRRVAEPAVVRAPVVTTRTDVETRALPFETEVIRDATMLRGTRRVEAEGEPGEETLRYLVTLTDGRPTARRLLSSTVTAEPQSRVVAVGSRRQSVVDPFCEPVLNFCLPFGRSAG